MSDSDARQKQLQVAGKHLEGVSLAIMGHRQLQTDVVGISIRGPRSESEEILMTIRGLSDDGSPVVAFLVGPSLLGLFTSLDNMLTSGQLRWKPDQWAK